MPFLNDINRMWRDKAREVAEKVVRPLARSTTSSRNIPGRSRTRSPKRASSGVWIPKEYGGAGGDVLDLCLVIEELSRACGGVGVLYA